MIKIKRTLAVSFLCVILVLSLVCEVMAVSAASEMVVSSSDANADVMLVGTFNNWTGATMDNKDVSTFTKEIALEAGNYQFKIIRGEEEFGHPGTIKDTTVTVSDSGWLMSDSINAKCTLIATGGVYTFEFDTLTHRLKVIKDGVTSEEDNSDKLTVNFGGGKVVAGCGDTLTYTVSLSADKWFEDVQTILSYNEEKLSLVKVAADNTAESEKACPNISDVIYNSEHPGVVALNASDVAGYDFTDEKVYLTLDFKVTGTGETYLEFTAQEMTAVDSSVYYAYSTKVNDGAVFTENLVISDALEVPQKNPSFSGASLALQENLCINFKANKTLITEIGYEDLYAVFTMNGTTYVFDTYEISGDKLVFAFDDISPANMDDIITATLYGSYDGVEYKSKTVEYSVAMYCYNMLDKYSSDDYAEFRTLLVDLLNYGGASQLYVGYNADNPVNGRLTAEQAKWGTSESPEYKTIMNLAYKTVENPTVSWKSGGLVLGDSITMRCKISAEDYSGLYVKIEALDMVWTVSEKDFVDTSNGKYIYFSELNSAQMREPVYLTVYRNGEAVSNTLRYSIESYAYSKQADSNPDLVNLIDAMMKYGDAAYAYVY